MKEEKVFVYIGRFQIAHLGHEETIKAALKESDRLVIIVGSSEIARDPRNPFTFNERFLVLDAICERLAKEEWSIGHNVKYDILPVHDYVYNNTKWLTEVQSQVLSVTNSSDVTLIGYDKDVSTKYLQFFPQWKRHDIGNFKIDDKQINATDIRNQYLSLNIVDNSLIPEETFEFLTKFKVSHPYVLHELMGENQYIKSYRDDMTKNLPYDTIPFLTGDSLVVCSGHILLVKRKTFPGKGLYALPGGFFDKDKDLSQVDTAIRELREETKIKVPEKVLRGSIQRVEEFGDFGRSLRWRIITRCVYISLNDTSLPKVRGSDDAEKAFWMPIGEVIKNRDKFFEDHLSIIDVFLGIL